MAIILSKQSALEFYLRVDPLMVTSHVLSGTESRRILEKSIPHRGDCNLDYLYDELGFVPPVTVAVSSSHRRRLFDGITCHVQNFNTDELGRSFPKLLKISDGLYVVPPEVCFAQMSKELEPLDLIYLGLELCGSYRIATGIKTEIESRSALCSPFTLAHACRCVPNSRQAANVVKYIAIGAESPMEIVLFMILCLPYAYGGFAFPQGRMNECVFAMESGKEYRPDLYWPNAHIAFEYKGEQAHDIYHSKADDWRENDLLTLGVEEVKIWKDDIWDIERMTQHARFLAKRLGRRIRPRSIDYFQKQDYLFRKLRECIKVRSRGWAL